MAEEAVLRVQRPAAQAGLAVAQDGLLVEQKPSVKETMAHHLLMDLVGLCIGAVVVVALEALELLKILLHLAIQEEQGLFHQ
jgi:hypothetical protein